MFIGKSIFVIFYLADQLSQQHMVNRDQKRMMLKMFVCATNVVAADEAKVPGGNGGELFINWFENSHIL
jgi:hypothetical protein